MDVTRATNGGNPVRHRAATTAKSAMRTGSNLGIRVAKFPCFTLGMIYMYICIYVYMGIYIYVYIYTRKNRMLRDEMSWGFHTFNGDFMWISWGYDRSNLFSGQESSKKVIFQTCS